ncbi:MAG: ATP-grasp domain-containing protein [Chloroflexi bacterium]|uniref:biotin carboxylase n=1 Tax=Candidatus Chlorohelix allophototropha TaxID=3003348 RepID=A0A8T7M9E1_9CHLR|nr:ATP-grasp domain-containing protein [Chloroflexota bacterium]WJW68666.1 ATP-grasp domain-containing protein [Chloroflexota bacterium L227-S17]
MFNRILIANRGEIARRIIRTCKRMGIETVAVHSDADMMLPFVNEATYAILIGLAPAHASYLNMEIILEVAQQAECEAIHPGYGFLAENPMFADRCQELGMVFIGPSPEAMAAMGEKVAARELMRKAGVPVAPGTSEPISDIELAVALAEEIGYPVLVKPSAGGGGIGMTIANNADKLRQGIKTAQSRAQRAFGDDSVFIERYVPGARHVEVQVLFDAHGQGVHLYERECSVQRRYQKVIEETPSPALVNNPELRQRMTQAALQAAAAVGYRNAGTVEFILGENGEFYFLEMNTRLQVEHPVTEMTLGLDLVELQLRVAAGEPLPLKQAEFAPKGHAIEFRIYAEDPVSFLPQPGTISLYQPPELSEFVRLDSGYGKGDAITPHYDPLIAKLVVWGENRAEALERSRVALSQFQIEGLKTNLPLHLRLLDDPAFVSGNYNTGLLKA